MKLEKIKEQRLKNSLTCEFLAKKMNIYRSSYYRKEKGEIAFKVQEIAILKKELGLTIEDIEDIFFNG